MSELEHLGVVIFIFISIVLFFRYVEKYQWNKGVCRKSGHPWKFIKSDYMGVNHYTDGCGNRVYISHGFDRK